VSLTISFDDIICLYNFDIVVEKNALAVSLNELAEKIREAQKLRDERIYMDAVHGIGYLAKLIEGRGGGWLAIPYEEFRKLYEVAVKEEEQQVADKNTKTELTRIRRTEFGRQRAQLKLAMLDVGKRYVCAWPECDERTNLTIDHIIPISRGGSDEIENLQFLCRWHNSAKGDR